MQQTNHGAFLLSRFSPILFNHFLSKTRLDPPGNDDLPSPVRHLCAVWPLQNMLGVSSFSLQLYRYRYSGSPADQSKTSSDNSTSQWNHGFYMSILWWFLPDQNSISVDARHEGDRRGWVARALMSSAQVWDLDTERDLHPLKTWSCLVNHLRVHAFCNLLPRYCLRAFRAVCCVHHGIDYFQGFGGHTLDCQAFVNTDDEGKGNKGALSVFRRYIV